MGRDTRTRRLIGVAVVLWTVVLLTADTPSDPFYPQQWHLKNTGQGGGVTNQDINVEPIWSAFRGSSGEVIAIVDDGLEIRHEDLIANVVPGLSHNYVNGSSDPTPSSGTDLHGTSVGGVAAARGFNGIGVSGVAPQAGLAGFNFLKNQLATNEVDALSRSNQIVDIYSNSWGPADGGYSLGGMSALTEAALANGVANGRGGRGSIYVWAAGNGLANGGNDNSNYDGYANSRYAIAVSASTNTGAHAYYSEPGANILVNAPSNGGTLGIMTTDLMGPTGCNPGTGGSGCGPNPITNQNYTAYFGGTSAAAPIVSGIAALMLQANPNLGWRDVREILATTADKNSSSDVQWTTNGAGYHISHTLGFGRVNATAAVQAARTWTNLGREESAVGFDAPGMWIPDSPGSGQFGAPVARTITISDDLRVEYVEVVFSSRNHTYWGDLEIVLQSPVGTKSRLAETHVSDPGPYDAWRFGSVRHLGESSRGQWSLTVRDGGPQDTGTFDAWTLRIYGVRNNAQVPLTVSVTGSGGVTSNPIGINCGQTCTALFPAGSTVALTPTPGTGFVFAGWGGDPDCLDGQVTLNQATSCTAFFTPVAPPLTPRTVDTNGDGRSDILFYTPSSGAWTTALGDAGGGFQFVTGSWDPGWTVTPARLNTDALTDFFLYNPTTGQWRQALSTGSGTFTYTTGTFSPGWQVAAGHLRPGPLDDVFVYNPTTGGAYHCVVDGAGGFSGFFYQNWSPGWDLHLADLDGDQIEDVFVYNPTTGRWYSCLNDGPGLFRYHAESWSPGWTLTVGDFDGNARDDLFVYNETSGRWFTCVSVGDGTFTYSGKSWSPGWHVFRARLDADATDDLFVYNPTSGHWFQCFSDGTGGFRRYVAGTWSPDWHLTVTDLDGDGLDDVFVYHTMTGEYFQCLTAPAGDFRPYLRGTTASGATVIGSR